MKYRYTGPTSGVSLQEGEAITEVMLHTNTDVELPEGNEYVATLVALGHLVAVATGPASKRAAVATDKGA